MLSLVPDSDHSQEIWLLALLSNFLVLHPSSQLANTILRISAGAMFPLVLLELLEHGLPTLSLGGLGLWFFRPLQLANPKVQVV